MVNYYLIAVPLCLAFLAWLYRRRPILVGEPLGAGWIAQRLPVWEKWDAYECASRGVNMFVQDGHGKPLVRVVRDEKAIAERDALSARMDAAKADRERQVRPKVVAMAGRR